MLVGAGSCGATCPGASRSYGAELGLLSAMIAVGLALTYRANRIINFAQADLGIVPSLLARAADPVEGLEHLARAAARARRRGACSARSSR